MSRPLRIDELPPLEADHVLAIQALARGTATGAQQVTAMWVLTGMLCGATGVFVIPTLPYLTSLEMDSEELVQSIGINAFVCPLALGIALAVHGQYKTDVAWASCLAVLPAVVGTYAGQKLRRRLAAATFMRWFFAALVALGGYMFLRSAGLARLSIL